MIAPVVEILKQHSEDFKKSTAIGRKLDKELKILCDKHARLKSKYLQTCVNAEELSEQLSNSFEMSPDKRNKTVNKLLVVKKDVDESQKQYLNAVYALNACKQRYANSMTQALNEIQAQETERQTALRD